MKHAGGFGLSSGAGPRLGVTSYIVKFINTYLHQVLYVKKHPDSLHSFANLPPEVETELHSLLKVRTFSSGETIFMQDETPDALYLVASGRVKVVRVTQEGYESFTSPNRNWQV